MKEIEQRMYQLFVPQRFAEDLEAQGIAPVTAAMKAQERKKDVRRIEAALESLGIPFRHQREGTTARLTEADRASLLALLSAALPARAELDISEAFESRP
jgi:hypothetical protein